MSTAEELEELKSKVETLESQERLDRGLVAAVNRGLTAVTNGQQDLANAVTALREEYRADRAARKLERAADRKELLRLASLPLGGLGFIISGQAGASTQPQLLTTLIVLVLAALFPELRDVLFRRQTSLGDDAPASSGAKAEPAKRGNGLASEPPARSGH